MTSSRSGHAALASAAGPLGDSEVDQSVRIAENIDIFDFEISTEELAAIDALNTGQRGGPEPKSIALDNFGRPIPED
jgi:hypothetical protein